MNDIDTIVKRINDFTFIKNDNPVGGKSKYSYTITVKKEPIENDNSLNIPIRTEDEVFSILDKLGFDKKDIQIQVDKFNNLRTKSYIKRIERFIVVTNKKQPI